MYLVNTTYIVSDAYEKRFLDWATGTLVKELQAREGVSGVTICRIRHRIEPGTVNYAVQYRVDDLAVKDSWERKRYATVRCNLAVPAEAVLEFTTEMEII